MNQIEQNKARILIVDDIPQNIQILGSVLTREQYQIAYAENGMIALSLVEQVDFDLILLDIMMPHMNGFEVCHQLKSNNRTKDIPIIFLTAVSDTKSIEQAFKIGGQDYVVKPFNFQELLSRVRTHLKLKQNNDAIRKQKAELELINNRLKQANISKDKFFSIIAHDLKNPFSDLTSLSELLKNNLNKYDFNKTKRFVKQIYKLSKKGYNLLENLLEWSRAQTGGIERKPEHINLRHLILNVLSNTANMAEKKDVELSCEVDETVEVYTDRNMLQTVIRNLVTNAIKFNKPKGKVVIKEKRLNSDINKKNEQKFSEVSIEDTGIGLAQSDLSKLFRIDVPNISIGKSKEKGTGLGLILCKEFVERNGGKMHVLSELDRGSIFSFTIPIHKL
jgi:signal transduction histidine kinase